jgi:hypothetical protein
MRGRTEMPELEGRRRVRGRQLLEDVRVFVSRLSQPLRNGSAMKCSRCASGFAYAECVVGPRPTYGKDLPSPPKFVITPAPNGRS